MTIYERTTPMSDLTHEEAVVRARGLAPAIRERAATAEAQRRQPEATIQAIVDAGLVRLLMPRRWGGYELPLDALVNSAIEIARADASAGWCYAFLVAHPWVLAHFSDEAQRDVWTHRPDALIATSFAPAGHFTSVEGGYRLSGNWPWSSGVDHCAWNMLAGLPESMDGPPRIFLLPSSDYEILDTWFVAGLSASGSKNVEVKEAFVPEHRTVLLPDLVRGQAPGAVLNTGPLYNLPLLATFPVFLAAPLLGATLGAYETWRDTSRNRYTRMSHELVAAFSHQQIRLAEIAAEIAAAQSLLHETLDIIRTGGPLTPDRYNRVRLYYVACARFCIQAIERLYTNSGGSANYETNSLQRYWRDVHAMAAHIGLNFDAAGEAFGRAELGLPSNPHDPFAL
ncbi:MAG: acyl-CoA dehydrogenase family protein [Chloroflexi bacterium]|nr:acyl-CoA dehydrogenase family protein [Chloroflexota bacterium]